MLITWDNLAITVSLFKWMVSCVPGIVVPGNHLPGYETGK